MGEREGGEVGEGEGQWGGEEGGWRRGSVGSKGKQKGRGNREVPKFNFVHGSDSFINT